METARQALRLWRLYAWLDLTWVTQNPSFVLTYVTSDLVLGLASVTATLLLAERFAGIGPWSRDQVGFMLGFAMLARALVEALFGYNVAFISRRVGRGQLDHTLIQPQPLWLSLLTDGFTPFAGGITLLPGLALLVWTATRLGLAITPGWLGLFVLNLAAAAAIVLAFSFIWGSLAFWAPRAAEEISSSAFQMIDQLKGFPLDGAGVGLVGGLLSIVPAGFVAWFPARALLAIDPAPADAWITPLAALGFLALAAFIFRQGLDHYGRVGSQRYHAMGHRR